MSLQCLGNQGRTCKANTDSLGDTIYFSGSGIDNETQIDLNDFNKKNIWMINYF